MAYIAIVPPIRFINIGSPVGLSSTDPNRADDVLIIRAFMIYLSNFRQDLAFTKVRLKTLAGSMDADLAQMIVDYKEFHSKRADLRLPPEERRNSRITPQSERFALQPVPYSQSTMMALNFDIKPLPKYGDTVVDVMCNLFPIRGVLTGLPVREDAYWRDLARNKIPFNQWYRRHKQDALNERIAALQRISRRTGTTISKEDLDKWDEDNELFVLLQHYSLEMKSFTERHTRVELATSPNPSKDGQNVTLTVTVASTGGQVPTGTITAVAVQQELARVYGRRNMLDSRGHKHTLSNGKATVSLGPLPKATYSVIAAYPDTGDLLSSAAEITHEVN